jgi:hypothetical protein
MKTWKVAQTVMFPDEMTLGFDGACKTFGNTCALCAPQV